MSFKDHVKRIKKEYKERQSTKLVNKLGDLMRATPSTTEQQVKMIDLKTRFEENLEKLRTEMLEEQIKIIETTDEEL